jgi:hypothetical protein
MRYNAIPLPASEFGERLYERGYQLVSEYDLRLDEIVWDADEVLWDWLMDASRMLKRAIPKVFTLDFSHREYYTVRPGVFELIWGMRHACFDAGHDPYMRVWTNGYPWRIWMVAREIPGFAELLGPPANVDEELHESFIHHPRVFYRGDYVDAVRHVLDDLGRIEHLLEDVSAEVRGLIARQLQDAPFDSSFKLPELARLRDKQGFRNTRILIDDRFQNIDRFVASGRSGIHLQSRSPRILLDKVPNTVWRSPREWLDRLVSDVALDIADGLERLAHRRASGVITVDATPSDREHRLLEFEVDVPDHRLRDEWIEPISSLKKSFEAV